jgi:penicillin amidase
MPHLIDPKSGVIFNWNNRPTEWWPNSDTPAWGPIFRNSALRDALGKGPYNIRRLERAAWQIARTDETWPYFAKFAGGDPQLKAFDGWMLDGSYPASYYRTWQDQVRRELFLPVTGDFLGESNFRLVAQPSVVWKALNGKTKLDYRQGRDVAGLAASKLAGQSVAPYVPGSMPSPDGIRIPYSNRGTYIQLVELLSDGIRGRNVAPPGIAESGEHDRDQANLARTWTFRPMLGWPSNPR